jgi:hypothetical protein
MSIPKLERQQGILREIHAERVKLVCMLESLGGCPRCDRRCIWCAPVRVVIPSRVPRKGKS